MKLISAVIKPHRWEDVRAALETMGITGMTVMRGLRLRAPEGTHRGLPRCGVRHLAGAQDQDRDRRSTTPDVDEVVEAIVAAARTGNIGDGKVWVTDVETVVRVRTGDRDQAAL